jgi:starvation-inducible outer membrane lipoprotein
MLRPTSLPHLRRTALLLTTALALSGCIFGNDDVDEAVAVRPPAVFTAQNPTQFASEVQEELSYRPSVDPAASARMQQAIREIVAFASLRVAPESYVANLPDMPDIKSVDPAAQESLRILHAELEDLLQRGVMLEELEAKALEMRNTAAETYAEAAKSAIALLDNSRDEVLHRQSQVQAIAGQLAFVKPHLTDWGTEGARLSGQIINLSPVDLIELGLEVIALQPESSARDWDSGEEKGAVQAELIMKFAEPLRAGETRTLKGYELILDGDAPADPLALSGAVVVSTTYVTMGDGTTLTGDEYDPALNYLDKLEADIVDFVREVPQKITQAVNESLDERPR